MGSSEMNLFFWLYDVCRRGSKGIIERVQGEKECFLARRCQVGNSSRQYQKDRRVYLHCGRLGLSSSHSISSLSIGSIMFHAARLSVKVSFVVFIALFRLNRKKKERKKEEG